MQVKDRVKKLLEEVRPQLQADGGDIELVGVENGVVTLRMKGACVGCPMSNITLQWGIVSCIKKRIPEITNVDVVQ